MKDTPLFYRCVNTEDQGETFDKLYTEFPKLERELAAVTAERDRLKGWLETETMNREEFEKLRAERDALKAILQDRTEVANNTEDRLRAERDEAIDHQASLRLTIATLQTALRLCREPLRMMAYLQPKFISLDGNVQDPCGVHQALTEVLKLVPS